MNGIVRVTNKSANPIDVLRSALAKEARRLSNALESQFWSGLGSVTEIFAAAEAMIVTPEYQALVGGLRAALALASVEDITRELGLVFACYPAKDLDIGVLVACAVDEVIRERPSKLRLLVSARRIRRKCKFRPSIAEIIAALDDANKAVVKAKQIIVLPKRLEEAVPRLQRLVGDGLKQVGALLSDRKCRAYDGKAVEHIDYRLKEIRNNLADVLPRRVTALEPQRLLITQSINITESEKAKTENHAVVGPEDDIPW
jgi:hypothetical protein